MQRSLVRSIIFILLLLLVAGGVSLVAREWRQGKTVRDAVKQAQSRAEQADDICAQVVDKEACRARHIQEAVAGGADADTCKKLSGLSRDGCYLAAAIRSLETDLCRKIEKTHTQELCTVSVQNARSQTAEPQVCEHEKDPTQQNECVLSLLDRTGWGNCRVLGWSDVRLCEEVDTYVALSAETPLETCATFTTPAVRQRCEARFSDR